MRPRLRRIAPARQPSAYSPAVFLAAMLDPLKPNPAAGWIAVFVWVSIGITCLALFGLLVASVTRRSLRRRNRAIEKSRRKPDRRDPWAESAKRIQPVPAGPDDDRSGNADTAILDSPPDDGGPSGGSP
jgi:heme exporter protein D